MKPRNFPARKLARQQKAFERFIIGDGCKAKTVELAALGFALCNTMAVARGTRTKIRRDGSRYA